MGRHALELAFLSSSPNLLTPCRAGRVRVVAAHPSRRQISARLWPEQVRKLEIVCAAEAKIQGHPVSYNELLVALVEDRYSELPPNVRRSVAKNGVPDRKRRKKKSKKNAT